MSRIGLVYARFSMDEAGEFSIDSQIRRGIEYAQHQGIDVPDNNVFADEFSGFTLDRPNFNSVKRLITERKVESVIVYKVNRIARKSHLADYFLQEIMFTSGVELHIVEWGRAVRNHKDDLLLFGLQAQFAQFDAMNIREQTMRGKQERLDQGVWVGQGISKYGYGKQTVWKDWYAKKRREIELFTIDEEAQVILRIFEYFVLMRAEGRKDAIASICAILNDEGLPTPSRSRAMKTARSDWNPSMIYSILRDEAYIGHFHFYKQRRNRLSKGPGSSAYRPKKDWQLVEFPHLRIISQELWETAQSILNTGRGVMKEPLYNYLMNKRLKCAACDDRFSMAAVCRHGRKGQVYTYYACGSRTQGRRALPGSEKCVLPPSIRTERIDPIFWNWLVALINDPEAMLKGYQYIQNVQFDENKDLVDEIERAEKRIANCERELAKYADMFAKDLISEKLMREKKEELDQVTMRAKVIRAEYQSKMQERKILTDEEIRYRVRTVHEIKEAVGDLERLSFDERKQVIRLLDVSGRIGLQDDRVYVDILWCNEFQDRKWVDSQYS